MYFAVLVDHKVKIKENEKRDEDKYLDLELWKMRVTVISMITDDLGMICKGLVRVWEGLKSNDEQRPSKLQDCLDWPEY